MRYKKRTSKEKARIVLASSMNFRTPFEFEKNWFRWETES